MMQISLRSPGPLFQLVTLISISITAGLKCSSCLDVTRAQVTKNTVSGFTFYVNITGLSSPNCKTAVNGVSISGVSVKTCNNNPINSQMEYRCVTYSGTVTATATVVVGSSAGEISADYEGTYRNCMLINVGISGSCAQETVTLPEGNDLRTDVLNLLPSGYTSVSVAFHGNKCVSYPDGTSPSKAAVQNSCAYIVLLFLFVYFFV